MNIKREYTDEFIADAVELVQKSDKSLTQVAKSLGVSTSTVRQWMGPPKKEAKIGRLKMKALTIDNRKAPNEKRIKMAEKVPVLGFV